MKELLAGVIIIGLSILLYLGVVALISAGLGWLVSGIWNSFGATSAAQQIGWQQPAAIIAILMIVARFIIPSRSSD